MKSKGFYNRPTPNFAPDQNKSKFSSKALRAQSAPMFKNFKSSNEHDKKQTALDTNSNSNSKMKKPAARPITVNFKRENNTAKYWSFNNYIHIETFLIIYL